MSYATTSSRLEYVELAHVVYASVPSVSFAPTIIGSSVPPFSSSTKRTTHFHQFTYTSLTLSPNRVNYFAALFTTTLLSSCLAFSGFCKYFTRSSLYLHAVLCAVIRNCVRPIRRSEGEVDTSQCAHGQDHGQFDR